MKNIQILFILLALFQFACGQEVNYDKLGIDEGSVENLRALAINEAAPDFNFNIDDKKYKLSEYVQSGDVVLIFYRGDWCPVCNRYLSEFQEDLHKLEEQGMKVLAITPQQEEYIDNTKDMTGLKIPVISDDNSEIAKSYHLSFEVKEDYDQMIKDRLSADIAKSNGSDEALLPVPATYVISKDMKVKYVHFDPNYKNRASVDDILGGLN